VLAGCLEVRWGDDLCHEGPRLSREAARKLQREIQEVERHKVPHTLLNVWLSFINLVSIIHICAVASEFNHLDGDQELEDIHEAQILNIKLLVLLE